MRWKRAQISLVSLSGRWPCVESCEQSGKLPAFGGYVRIDDGHIIERVQQADVLAQMRQLYGKALGLVGLDAMFLRL